MFSKITNAYRAAYSGLPPQIWMLSFAIFVNRCGTMVLPFLTIYLTESRGYSESAAGFMISFWGIGSVIGTWIGGQLTSRVGCVRLQIIFLMLSVPLFVVLPFCNTYWQLVLAILLLSIVSEGIRPASSTAISVFSTPELRTRAFALQRMALNLGFSFGPAIGGLLIRHVSFFWVFIADAMTTLGCALILAWFFGFRKRSQQPEEIATTTPSESRSPTTDREYMIFLGLTLLCGLVFFQFHATYPLYLKDQYRLNEFQIGLLFAVNTTIIVLFEMILVEYVQRWQMLILIGWGNFLTCLGFGLLPFSDLVSFCVFTMVVLTMGEMLSMPLSTSWVSKRSEGYDTGIYMGWYSMNFALACIIGPAVGGILYEFNKELVFHLGTAIGVIVLLGFYWLQNRIPHDQNRAAVDELA